MEQLGRRPVSNPFLYEWIALRRVHDGGMAKSAGAYFDRGHPAPGHLTGVFDLLVWTGLVTVADGDPVWDLRRLRLTDTGRARYAALSECQQRDSLLAPPPEHATTEASVGRATPAPIPEAAGPP